jgi:hypothetical protein
MDDKTRIELEAATFRRLIDHLRKHPEAQNIDLMILADFCRNCLAKWYAAAAHEKGLELDYPAAQELIYGIPYEEWKKHHQKEATAEQMAAFKKRQQAQQAGQ